MKYQFAAAALAVFAACLPLSSQAQTEIQWWHSMGGALGEWVNDQAKDFNASQK
jgi:sn-glycerol 3-phosphate transport system substrate-binding protein